MTPEKSINDLLKIIEKLHAIKDLDLLLENILHEARIFAKADAGTLYICRDKRLFFAFIENDTLASRNQNGNRHVYMNESIPLDKTSIAGFCALSGESLLIDDVYSLPDETVFRFNAAFDKKSGYRTVSILNVPLKDTAGKITGVLQLINALNSARKPVPFSQQDRLFITYFAQHAAMALEKAEHSKEIVQRMIDLVSLRDPHETVLHCRRVGEYALELFDAYAIRKNFSLSERNRKKEAFRLAAMLHDIGKLAMNRDLFSKHGEYSIKEKKNMYWHTIYGARLFQDKNSFWDRIVFEVTLNHHERWDGKGYPGHLKDLNDDTLSFGPGKRGKEIPLSARIVAIADVFDALMRQKSYKEAWDFDTALGYMRNKSGKQFDPELINLFLTLEPRLKAIHANIR